MNHDRLLPEPPKLPGAHSGGFDRAWTSGRARRRLKTAGLGAGLAAVVGVTGFAYSTFTVSASDTLQPADPGGVQTTAPSLAPSPSPAPGLPHNLGPSALPQLPRDLPRTASPQPSPSRPRSEDSAQQNQTGYPGRRQASRPVHRTYHSPTPQANTGQVGGGEVQLCDPSSVRDATPWCGSAGVSDVEGGDLLFRETLCRNQNGTQNSLAFRRSQEVEYEVVTPSGQRIWLWSAGARVTDSPHGLSVEPGGCLEWTTTWTPELANGQRLPAGDYLLRAHLTATDATASSQFTSTFRYAP